MSRRPLVDVVSHSGLSYPTVRTVEVWISHSSKWQHPVTPVFHAVSEYQPVLVTDPEGRLRQGWEITACCGPHISGASWLVDALNEANDYQRDDTGLRMPLRWALQFARPCRRCWP